MRLNYSLKHYIMTNIPFIDAKPNILVTTSFNGCGTIWGFSLINFPNVMVCSPVTFLHKHSNAATECCIEPVISGLGRRDKSLIASPLNDVVTKIFGFASIKGRHLQEGNDPTYEEAELVVHLSAAICTYLCKVELPTNV